MIKVFPYSIDDDYSLEEYLNFIEEESYYIISVVWINGSEYAMGAYQIIAKKKE